MRSTRKKVIKTVYNEAEDSDAGPTGDFSDSGSDAKISEDSATSEEDVTSGASSAEEFTDTVKKYKRVKNVNPIRRTKFAKAFINKIRQQSADSDDENAAPTISVKDLTEEDKLLPSFLNLSESDSSDDECPKASTSKNNTASTSYNSQNYDSDSETQTKSEYKDVWTTNIPDNSEEVAKQTFLELEKHKTKIEEAKASLQRYSKNKENHPELDVKDLLAQGEEEVPVIKPEKRTNKGRKKKADSDSEIEDWEEVNEAKAIPQQGLQLIVDFPDAACRKSKKLDLEMMMKRKINRVKKEYQVYMHKVHILCWLGHGIYVNKVLNDQELLAAVLSLLPSSGCYPGERIDLKYVEQITNWYKDKIKLQQDKNEDKFRPKAPPLKEILLSHIKNKVTTTKKYLVFIFVALMRSLGLQCRIMFNFVSLPIKPPSSELCSLSTKQKEKADSDKSKSNSVKKETDTKVKAKKNKAKLVQVDGNDDSYMSCDEVFENMMQVDGNDDVQPKTRSKRSTRAQPNPTNVENEDVSPPKRSKLSLKAVPATVKATTSDVVPEKRQRIARKNKSPEPTNKETLNSDTKIKNSSKANSKSTEVKPETPIPSPRKTRRNTKTVEEKSQNTDANKAIKIGKESLPRNNPAIEITNADENTMSTYFTTGSKSGPALYNMSLSKNRRRSKSTPKIIVTPTTVAEDKPKANTTSRQRTEKNKINLDSNQSTEKGVTKLESKQTNSKKITEPKLKPTAINTKTRARSAPENSAETSQYFNNLDTNTTQADKKPARRQRQRKREEDLLEDAQRVSHKDLVKSSPKKNDVTGDLVKLIKGRVKEAKMESKKQIVKGKAKKESDEDSDFLPEEDAKNRRNSVDDDDDFKPTKISPKPPVKRKIDRRVLSVDEDLPKNKVDVWCEVYVEELEQWVPVDVIKAKVHCAQELYKGSTHPVAYILGWDNNNYLKDLTRRYVPSYNTVTRKLRVDQPWWDTALRPWTGPRNARDREEDELLNRAQLDAPLPKAISEYKNHPLYALSRHLLKFEAIYPPDAATLGFVRGEAVYPRECVYVCRSRDIWLKEAKTVKLGEKPYKIVKSRPKWDRLSNKLINGLPLELFGPWQTQDYEPPTAENGVVPRNAYGNVELFKMCMLPKGTVHLRLPGLHKVARKLNVDAAPAVTGFDFNGGYSHPVFDGYVVCKEFQEIITEAWLKDQEEQERKEREKYETRVYGNWKRLIKGLMIRERLKHKYGFQEPSVSAHAKKQAAKGPKLVVKKRS